MSEPNKKPDGEGGKPSPGAPTGAPGSTGTKPVAGPPGKAPPKNPGFVTCTVDGKEVVAEPGTNMIQAARLVGSEIPYYCYHPRLSIAANCRMCLVEVSNSPKLVPACQTPLAEGLAVKTTTDKVRENQRAVLEFILINHPVDCAICDQAGECKLQDYYMKYNFRPSRLDDRKVLKSKRKVLGPLVVLDQERCILCTRCVRFMDEVAKEPQLGLFGRGSHERIDVFPGASLDSNYSGNTVDICPVGALLSRDFRFRARAWFLSTMPSICTGCSRGCNVFADFYGLETYRYRPRENERINKTWICDQGRLSYKYLNVDRVLTPRIGRGRTTSAGGGPVSTSGAAHAAGGGSAQPRANVYSRGDAVHDAVSKLKPLVKTAQLAVLVSPVASNEDLLACLDFARKLLGVSAAYVGGRQAGAADHYLMTADKNPNRRGIEWIARAMGMELRDYRDLVTAVKAGSAKALYAVGEEVPAPVASIGDDLKGIELIVCQAVNAGPLADLADVLLPASAHIEDEGSFVNLDGIIQRFRPAYPPRAHSQPHWKWASDLSQAFGLASSRTSASQVFRELAPSVPEFASFRWDESAPPAQERPGLTPLPAAADGRAPGYRELGVPRVKGI